MGVSGEVLGLVAERAVSRPYTVDLSHSIWMAFKPMIKIYLSIGTGFFLAKTNILTPQLSKGISKLILLVFMPALIFNNIVSQIKDTDIKLLGIIVLSGFIFYMTGLGWGFILRLISPVPRAWFGGLLLCCMVNNSSDLPLAYVQTVGKNPSFPSDLAARGVSYCVLFTIIFILLTFNLGGARLVEWDAKRVDPHREDATVPIISWEAAKRTGRWFRKVWSANAPGLPTSHRGSKADSSHSVEKPGDLEAQDTDSTDVRSLHEVPYMSEEALLQRELTRSRAQADQERHFGSTDVYYARRPSAAGHDEPEIWADAPYEISGESGPVAFRNLERHLTRASTRDSDSSVDHDDGSNGNGNPAASVKRKKRKRLPNPFKKPWAAFKVKWYRVKGKNRVYAYIFDALEDIFLPQMMALICGITVAMIPWVRRVFVKGQNIHGFRDAPDGNPPLDFLMDFFSFFAGAQVPLGLMLLGGTIATLKVGRMVPGFPRTVALICIFKLALLPIIACGWIHRLREMGWIDKEDPMIPIVLAVGAGTPSATVQIYLTLAWMDPTKESLELNCLAVSLMAQYLLLPISMTILMTFVIMHWV